MKAALPLLLIAAAMLAACIPATPAPETAAAPAPAPSAPAGPAAPSEPLRIAEIVPADWMRSADTPGAWRLAATVAAESEARFIGQGGNRLASLRCDRRARAVIVAVPDPGIASGALEIRTETLGATLPTTAQGRERAATVPADLPLLDAMALSKGRFAIGSERGGVLILPAWAEVSRVIEDCRG